MDVAIVKVRSKGKITIPKEMRKGIDEGEKLLIIKSGKQWIMKKASDLNNKLEENIEFAKKIERSWREFKYGNFTSSSAEDFLRE